MKFFIKQLAAAAIALSCTFWSASTTFGQWTEPKPLNDYALIDGWDDVRSRLATDQNGTVIATWVNPGSVAIARSLDNGLTWDQVAGNFLEVSALPHNADVVYAGSGNWVVMWVEELPGGAIQALSVVSSDNGQTWTLPELRVAGDIGREVDVASNGSGIIIATLHTRLLRSFDFGQTWVETPPQVSPVAPQYRPYSRIAHNGDNTWVHAYTRREAGGSAGETDGTGIYVATSFDNGESWVERRLQFQELPDVELFGDLAASGNQIGLVQKSGAMPTSLLLHVSHDHGNTWSPAQEVVPSIAHDVGVSLETSGNRWILVHNTSVYNNANNRVNVLVSDDAMASWIPVPFYGGGLRERNPVAVGISPGNFLMAFDQYQQVNPTYPGADYDIRTALLTQDEPAWQIHGFVNANAAIDLPYYDDVDVEMDVSPLGTAVATWLSNHEIFVARSADAGAHWSASIPLIDKYAAENFDYAYPKVHHVGDNTWVVYWHQINQPFTLSLVSRSYDDGLTWTAPEPVVLAHLDSNRNGMLMKSEYNIEDRSSSIKTSTDAGLTWSPELRRGNFFGVTFIGGTSWLVVDAEAVQLTHDDGLTWEYVQTPGTSLAIADISTDYRGNLVAVWATGLNFEFFVRSSRSHDFGRTWTRTPVEQKLLPNFGPLHTRARIAWVEEQRWIATWHLPPPSFNPDAKGTVYYSLSDDGGATWAPASPLIEPAPGLVGSEFPAVMAHAGNVTIAYNTVWRIRWFQDNYAPDQPFAKYDSDIKYVRLEKLSDIQDVRLNVNLKFKKANKDNIKAAGSLAIPAGFNPDGMEVRLDIGGVERVFVMDAKGKAKIGKDKFRLKFKSKKGVVEAQVAKFNVKLNRGNFSPALADEGLVNADTDHLAAIWLTLRLDGTGARSEIPVQYKAKYGKKGKAKSIKTR